MGTQHLFPSQSKPGCSVVRSPFWLLSLPAGSVQNSFFSEAHGHLVVDVTDEPWVVEKPKCLEERGSLGQNTWASGVVSCILVLKDSLVLPLRSFAISRLVLPMHLWSCPSFILSPNPVCQSHLFAIRAALSSEFRWKSRAKVRKGFLAALLWCRALVRFARSPDRWSIWGSQASAPGRGGQRRLRLFLRFFSWLRR